MSDFDVSPIYPSVDKTDTGSALNQSSGSSSSGMNGGTWSGYNKMFSTAVKFNEVSDRVLLDLGLTMYDSLPELLGNDVQQGMKFLKDIIERTIREYSQTAPEKMEIKLEQPGKSYTFVDNFDKYLAGEIGDRELILVPISTPFVKSATIFTSSRNWFYKKPTLYASEYAGTLPSSSYWGYFAAMPYKIEIAEDGNFTEDSVLYSTDDQRTQNGFYAFLNLEIAKRLRRMINSLSLGGNMELLPHLDISIQELEEEKFKNIRRNSAHLSYLWRK